MKTKNIFIIAALITVIFILGGRVVSSKAEAPAPVTPRFSHQQETWIAALEWCESNGVNTAVNWYDKDGTASYYAFQFKPGTLRYFGEKYGVIEKGKSDAEIMELLKKYEVQRAIVEYMVEDPGTNWKQQFPDCTRKLGRPPRG